MKVSTYKRISRELYVYVEVKALERMDSLILKLDRFRGFDATTENAVKFTHQNTTLSKKKTKRTCALNKKGRLF